ncbi:MAG: MMPL family transporter [Pseudomonadota bacterium]
MSAEAPNVNNGKKLSRRFQDRLKEAELYYQQGLLDDASAIFAALRDKLQTRLNADEAGKALRPSERNRLHDAIFSLNVRLKTVEQKKAAWMDLGGGSAKKIEPDLSAQNMIERGVLLQGLGLYDEAIDEFRRAASHQTDLVGNCYELIGASLIGKGDLEAGVGMLRQAFDLQRDIDEKRVAILERIAEAYELAGDKQQAVSTYRELILLDGNFGRALLKIEQLSAELKRSSLEFGIICKYPKAFLMASLAIALFFIAFIPFVKTADNVDYFTIENNPDIIFYNNFKKIFGDDEFFVIALQCDGVFSAERLTLLKRITKELEALEEVDEVLSLANVDDIVGELDSFEVRKFLGSIPKETSALMALRQNAVNNPLYAKNLISSDGKTAAIVVQPHERPEDNEFRKRLLSKTLAILKPYEGPAIQFKIAGWTSTNYSMSQYLKEDVLVFIPATYFLIILSIWLFFRNVRLMLLGTANITLCLCATMGVMGLLGVSLNNVTIIIIPLIMTLSLADTVHIFSSMDREVLDRFKDERQALAHVLNMEGLPCFLTTMTTAIGFISLAITDIPPIREFAWVATAGMGFEFLFGFFFLPPLILFCNPDRVYQSFKDGPRMPAFLRGLFRWVQKYSRWVLVGSVLLVIASGYETTQLKVETNLIEFFRKSSPVRTALDFVEAHLAGVGSLDISFKAEETDAFRDPANLAVIEKVQQFVSSLSGVDKTISFNDFLKDMNQSFHEEDSAYYRLPDTSELVSQYLLLYSSDDIEDFVNSGFNHARLTARISIHSSAKQRELIKKIEAFLQNMDNRNLTIRVTGRAVKDVSVIDALVNSQVSSLASAAIVISIVLFVVFRSVSLALLSMIPNVFPIILNFGIMGLLGIPLDTGTALISAIALGICVDDTVHFMTEYQRKRAEGVSVAEALEEVIQSKGRAIMTTGSIVCIGFGVLVFSRFMPVVHYGLLSAIIMVTGLAGELLLQPAVMLLIGRRRAKS